MFQRCVAAAPAAQMYLCNKQSEESNPSFGEVRAVVFFELNEEKRGLAGILHLACCCCFQTGT